MIVLGAGRASLVLGARRALTAGGLIALIAMAGCDSGKHAQAQTPGPSASASGKTVMVLRAVNVAGLTFVPAPPRVRTECQQTANALDYPIPCPTMLPEGTAATPPVPGGCSFAIVGWDRRPRCGAAAWHGWMVGSSQTPYEHLVVQSAPEVVRNPARAIDGPGMVPGSRVQARGHERVAGQLMRWYYVPPQANDGSAFMHHLVLVWSEWGHTYAYGFHLVATFAEARAFDLELVRNLVPVYPHS